MTWPELRASAAIIRREHQLACRSAAFWAMVALGSLLALWRATVPGTSAALAAYQTRQTIVLGVGVLAIFLGGAAARDRRYAVSELVLAKPWGSSPALVVTRFLGVCSSLLGATAIMLLVSGVGQAVLAGTPWRPGPYVVALLVSAIPIGLATALGFSLATLFTTPLASGIAALYWVVIPLTRAHLPMAFDVTLWQDWPKSLLLGAALVSLTAALYARPARREGDSGWRAGWIAALLFAAALAAVLVVTARGDDGLLEPDPVLSAMASQTAVEDRGAPGFWLTDSEGRLVGLSDFRGRPVVLAFWGPAAPDSASALTLLDEVARDFQQHELACIAVLLDRDAAAMRLLGREGEDGVLLLWDRGRHFGDGMEWSDSPLAVSYGVTAVPTAFLIDQKGTLVARLHGESNLHRVRPAILRLLGER